jgi:hypothetical protein
MTLEKLIEDYKKMVLICQNIDYLDRKSVANNNTAVDKMYKIVQTINLQFGKSGVSEFIKLMDDSNDGVNLWAAVQILEKMSVNKVIEEKALKLIEQEAKNSLGMRFWLEEFRAKKAIQNTII